MNCQQVYNNLPDYSDGLLDPGKTEAIQEHLTTCYSCRTEFRTFDTLLSGLRNLPEITPSGQFSRRLRQQIETLDQCPQRWGRHPRQWRVRFQYRLLVPSMIAFVLLLPVGMYLSSQQYQLEPSPTLTVSIDPGPPLPLRESETGYQLEWADGSGVWTSYPVGTGDGTSYVLHTVSYDQPGATIGF